MSRKALNIRTEKRLQAFLDIWICLICMTAAILLLRPGADLRSRAYITMSVISAAQLFGFQLALEGYAPSLTTLQERRVIIVLSCIYSLILSLIENWFFFGSAWLAKLEILSSALTMAVMLVGNVLFYRILHSKRFRKERLLVIAASGSDYHRMKRLKYGTMSGFDTWYESFDPNKEGSLDGLLKESLDQYDAVCIFDNLKNEDYEKIVAQAMLLKKEIYAIPKMIDINRNQANYTRFDDILAFHIQKYELSHAEEVFKRIMDLTFSMIGLVLAALPMLVIAIAIKATSPGPVLYKQLRYTRNKREFYIYKFRTMVPDAEKLSGPTFAQKDDPRITPVGKVLRAFRMDELPQLLNIIKGDMSIVGPRPERPFFVEQFEKEIPNYNYRFAVKAGLTSLSHVYGRYSTYIHDRTCFDLMYISNYSILLDLKIILLTTKTLLIKGSAEGEDEFKRKANRKEEEVAK